MDARLHVDPATLAWRGDRLPATGCVWIDADGVAFPNAGWNDFVIVIVAAFVHAEVMLVDHESATTYFMEGPHEVLLERTRLTLRTNGLIVRAGEIDGAWRESIVAAGEALLEHIETNGWSSRDVENLEKGLRALRPSSA
jgi:hypothetical protein